MKNLLLSLILMCTSSFVFAQLKKDGTPDMRYKANKELYGSSYSRSTNQYPTKSDGTPDMRYKANKELYGGAENTDYKSSENFYSEKNNSAITKSYIKQNGTFVQTYYRTKKNNTNLDNYSTLDNVNPYTGEKGYRAKDRSVEAFNYGSGYEIKTGSRDGQYYINRMGKKTYVPKQQ